MSNQPRLLVVDDEEVVRQGCRRIFAPQGFDVRTSPDAGEGLRLAQEEDFAAVVLDVRMPVMDGIEFLRQLRPKKPSVPVVLITGYPNIPDAFSAVGLGPSDYVTKPFTPEEITRSVQRLLELRPATALELPRVPAPEAKPEPAAAPECLFWDKSWLRAEADGCLRFGAMLAPGQRDAVDGIVLPQSGEAAYQGLALAGVMAGGKLLYTIAAPISGVVSEVNSTLAGRLSALWDDPLGEGWIGLISPSRFDEEVRHCKPRRVILVNADRASATRQRQHLMDLGCQVRGAASWAQLAPALREADLPVLLFDADWLGEQGPDLVGRVNAAAPQAKVVVVASAGFQGESAYRKLRIFYYALEPFADREMVEILDAAFSPRRAPLEAERRTGASESVSSILITDHHGRQVGLFVAGGLLSRDDGLGWMVRRKLLDKLYPMKAASNIGRMSQMKLLVGASMCDRLFVLLPRDAGRLPASLVRETGKDAVRLLGESGKNATVLAVQPASAGAGLTGFDERTMAALAEHVVHEMAA